MKRRKEGKNEKKERLKEMYMYTKQKNHCTKQVLSLKAEKKTIEEINKKYLNIRNKCCRGTTNVHYSSV